MSDKTTDPLTVSSEEVKQLLVALEPVIRAVGYMVVPLLPHGCICPPGANKECENPTCPRKPMTVAATAQAASAK